MGGSNNSPITLVAALKSYFEIGGSDLIREFKALTAKDKDDFVDLFQAVGIAVKRV
jgi:hypothetical protein